MKQIFYALIDSRSDCTAETHLAWGDLQAITDALIEECDLIINSFLDDMTMEDLEAEYYCEFEDYKALKDCDSPTEEMIASFTFTLSDCSVNVGCLVEGYQELVKAFSEYTKDKWTLDIWSMVPDIEETEENLQALDDELRSLNEDLDDDRDLQFFVEKDEL